MELLATIIAIVVCVYLTYAEEWKACNRVTLPDYTLDWIQMNQDVYKYGRQYIYIQNID